MAAPHKTELLGSWTVEWIDERPVSDGQVVFMRFTEDGRVVGKASCNRFTGGYALSGSELRFAQMAATGTACADALMQQERRLLGALLKVERGRLENQVLVPTDTDENPLVNARRSEDTALSGDSKGISMTDENGPAATTPPLLEDTVWQVENIDNGGIIDRSMITMDFTERGRILGSTGCNRYFGNATVAEGVLSLSGISSTRRACAPALMDQEQRLLTALNHAARFAIDKDTWLVVYDPEGLERLRAIRVDSDPTVERLKPQDIGSGTPLVLVFDCEVKGAISLHFVGPETIELTVGDGTHVLSRERTASGARYRKNGFEFWNKGGEALLTIGEDRFTCKRR